MENSPPLFMNPGFAVFQGEQTLESLLRELQRQLKIDGQLFNCVVATGSAEYFLLNYTALCKALLRPQRPAHDTPLKSIVIQEGLASQLWVERYGMPGAEFSSRQIPRIVLDDCDEPIEVLMKCSRIKQDRSVEGMLYRLYGEFRRIVVGEFEERACPECNRTFGLYELNEDVDFLCPHCKTKIF